MPLSVADDFLTQHTRSLYQTPKQTERETERGASASDPFTLDDLSLSVEERQRQSERESKRQDIKKGKTFFVSLSGMVIVVSKRQALTSLSSLSGPSVSLSLPSSQDRDAASIEREITWDRSYASEKYPRSLSALHSTLFGPPSPSVSLCPPILVTYSWKSVYLLMREVFPEHLSLFTAAVLSAQDSDTETETETDSFPSECYGTDQSLADRLSLYPSLSPSNTSSSTSASTTSDVAAIVLTSSCFRQRETERGTSLLSEILDTLLSHNLTVS